MIVLIILFSIILGPVTATDCDIKSRYFVNETAPAGTVLFYATKSATYNVTLSAVAGKDQPRNNTFLDELTGRFDLWQNETFVVISLANPLDLEMFHENYNADIRTVSLQIYCGESKDVQIEVQPVNEFPPVFENAPYSLHLPESTRVGEVVFDFKSNISDRDQGQTTNLFIYLKNYTGDVTDARSYFEIPTVTKGELILIKPLDYDAADAHRRFTLNISVEDDGRLENHTVLVIDILDVDDQNPYFKYPGCSTPCLVPQFDAITELHYTGVLQVRPVTLQGQDADTLNTTLLYSISAGNSHNIFSLNERTAEVSQRMSVGSSKLPDPSFRLIIEVRKNLTTDLSSKAILIVHVKERKENDTSYPNVGESKENDNIDLLIPVIILSVITALIIVAFIVILVLYRKNHQTMSIVPDKNKNKKFINDGATVLTQPTNGGVATGVETPVEGNTDTTKRKRKKKKSKKLLKKTDSPEYINDNEATTKREPEVANYLVNSSTLPIQSSFNHALPLPKIGSSVTTDNGTNTMNTNNVERKKQIYPSLTDAYQSEPSAWQTLRESTVVFNSK